MIESFLIAAVLMNEPPRNHAYELRSKPVQREPDKIQSIRRESRQGMTRTYKFIDRMRDQDPRTDLNKDGVINGLDLELFLIRQDQRRAQVGCCSCCSCCCKKKV